MLVCNSRPSLSSFARSSLAHPKQFGAFSFRSKTGFLASFTTLPPDHFLVKAKPVEIRLKKQEKKIEIDWKDGKKMSYPAEFLRVFSPSAEVVGHVPEQRKLVTNRKFVGIMGVEPVGNYAIKIVFDDFHDTGIYSWDYLHFLGQNKIKKIREYLKELKEAGKSRNPKTKPAPKPAPKPTKAV
eukprot:TRINITY_DN5460_c0_g1_i1.p1 TRINITY_DN5460_c0_g1~~TRINITY_DN5460_c0_g1_i1.p1  ORF type:complete len:192 (+),score=51.66 TRINITY_DN5460_c0_g1_i1:30-578(+)